MLRFNELSEATETDLVLSVVEQHEVGQLVSVGEWVMALDHADESCLTYGIPLERSVCAAQFVAAAPPAEQLSNPCLIDVELFVQAWVSLMRTLGPTHDRAVSHMNVFEKFAELTVAVGVARVEPHIMEPQIRLCGVVNKFYSEAVEWGEDELAFTAFAFKDIVDASVLAQVACLYDLPIEIIEEHAFTVPKSVAEKFVQHPNTPLRIRAALTATLPHL